MSKAYRNAVNRRTTPQSQPVPGMTQVQNAAGGYGFAIDPWKQFDRFLILGSEGGTYYVRESELTEENAKNVRACITSDGPRAVARIIDVSDRGLAYKNDPAIFALALCVAHGDSRTKHEALDALPAVCRIGTHILHFASYLDAQRGWGRAVRRAVANWYNRQEPKRLAEQLTKYQNRDGWSHRDIFNLAHPKPHTAVREALFTWAYKGWESVGEAVPENEALQKVWAFETLKSETDAKKAAGLISAFKMPRECVPTKLLTSGVVWEALLPHMKPIAMLRNLGNMAKAELLTPQSSATKTVLASIRDRDLMRKNRVHPLQVLLALKTYGSGASVLGKGTWRVTTKIVDALDDAFYAAFESLPRINKSLYFGVDVSGSMDSPMGNYAMSVREGAAALAMTGLRQADDAVAYGFSTRLTDLHLSPKMRLEEVVKRTAGLPFMGTDCALPMLDAIQLKLGIDAFVVITDNETWAGRMHPFQALEKYRGHSGRRAKLAVVGMTATNFTIANPADAGMLDVVGFDASVPQVLSDFVNEAV